GLKRTGAALALAVTFGTAVGYSAAGPMQTVHSQSAVSDSETDLLRTLYTRVNPSVVSITVRIPATQGTTGRQNQNPNQQQQPFAAAAGSGFVYDNAGHIITNAHVVEGATNIELAFSDGTMMRAKVVGIDPDSDIAVVQAQGDTSKYAPLPMANSDEVV